MQFGPTSRFTGEAAAMHLVKVYSVLEPEDDQLDWNNSFSITMQLLGRALVPPSDGVRHFRRVAAEGWWKVIGIARRRAMVKMGAPAAVIRDSSGPDMLLCAASSGNVFVELSSQFTLGVDSQWLYDNGVQSWLITVESIAKNN